MGAFTLIGEFQLPPTEIWHLIVPSRYDGHITLALYVNDHHCKKVSILVMK